MSVSQAINCCLLLWHFVWENLSHLELSIFPPQLLNILNSLTSEFTDVLGDIKCDWILVSSSEVESHLVCQFYSQRNRCNIWTQILLYGFFVLWRQTACQFYSQCNRCNIWTQILLCGFFVLCLLYKLIPSLNPISLGLLFTLICLLTFSFLQKLSKRQNSWIAVCSSQMVQVTTSCPFCNLCMIHAYLYYS